MLNKFIFLKSLVLLSLLFSGSCFSSLSLSGLEPSFYHVTHWTLDGHFGQANMGDVVILTPRHNTVIQDYKKLSYQRKLL